MSTKSECLSVSTLQARHFANDLGLASSRLQTFLRFAGLEPTDRPSGTWRTFSPLEVMTIATLARAKEATDLAIVRHPTFVGYLSDVSEFGEPSIAIWADGHSPVLITDLNSGHRVIAIEDADQRVLALLGSDVAVILRLTPIVDFVFRAIKTGGNSEQMALVEKLSSKRLHNLKSGVDGLQQEAGQLQSPHHDPLAKGTRHVNLEDQEEDQ